MRIIKSPDDLNADRQGSTYTYRVAFLVFEFEMSWKISGVVIRNHDSPYHSCLLLLIPGLIVGGELIFLLACYQFPFIQSI